MILAEKDCRGYGVMATKSSVYKRVSVALGVTLLLGASGFCGFGTNLLT